MIAQDNVCVPPTTGQVIINNIRKFGHSGLPPNPPPMGKMPDLPVILDLSELDRTFAEALGMDPHAAHYLAHRMIELADNEVIRGRVRQLFTEIKLVDADEFSNYTQAVAVARQWYENECQNVATMNARSLQKWEQSMEIWEQESIVREADTRTAYLDFMRSLRSGVTFDSISPVQYRLLMRLQELYPDFGFEKYKSWFAKYIRLTGTIPGINRDVAFYAEARALLDD